MILDLDTLNSLSVYRLLTHTIIPRPIAWVVTVNENGSYNAAPFSYFNAVSSNPAIAMISVGHKRDGSKKDTWLNLERTGYCTLHIANSELMAALNETARPLPEGESELSATNVNLVTEPTFSIPRIAEAPVAYAGELHDIHLLGNGPQAVIYLALKQAWVQAELLDTETMTINPTPLDPICRLGGEDYSKLGEIVRLARPT